LVGLAEGIGAQTYFISLNTTNGSQFANGFGGIGGLLRYVNASAPCENDEDDYVYEY
jgi:peptide subunit release factor 1 (eRF1)